MHESSSASSFQEEFSGHPVERDDYTLATRPIIEMEIELQRWLKRKIRGGIVYGRPRLGKSRALKHVRAYSQALFGKIVTFVLDCTRYESTTSTDRAFFTDFLYDVKYGLPNSGTANEKRRRLIDFMMSEALRAGSRRVLLFIDEAQYLSEKLFTHIMYLHNALEREGFLLYTVLVGQPQLLHRKNVMRDANKEQIIARFMAAEHEFHGIRNKTDVRYALSRYDEVGASEYPPGSGISFTAHFFPNAYQKGWRLAQLTDLVYDGFQEARVELRLAKTSDIPMAPFTALVDAILLESRSESSSPPAISADTIRHLIHEVGYEAYETALESARSASDGLGLR